MATVTVFVCRKAVSGGALFRWRQGVQVIGDCQHSVSIKHNLRVATQTQEAASTPRLQRQQSSPVQELFGDTVSCLRQLQTHFPDTNKIRQEGIESYTLRST